MKPLYCITAINRLTRVREKVSCSSTDTDILGTIRDTFLRTPPHKRAYVYPRIQIVQTELFR